MPKFIYVQIEGVEKPARIEADSIARETRTQAGQQAHAKLILKSDGKEVGEFNATKVIGWWLQDE